MQTQLVNDEPTSVPISGSPQLSNQPMNNLVKNGMNLESYFYTIVLCKIFYRSFKLSFNQSNSIFSYDEGDENGDKSGFSTHRSSLVDANSSLLCQLHSHQQQHRLEHEQNSPTHLDHLRSDNDKTKLFEDQFSKTKKPTATELQVCPKCISITTKHGSKCIN